MNGLGVPGGFPPVDVRERTSRSVGVLTSMDPCPGCGGRLRLATRGYVAVLVCTSCGDCWRSALGCTYPLRDPGRRLRAER